MTSTTTPSSRPRLIVFDLDGTLVDSRRDLADSANALLGEYGCELLPEEVIGRLVGGGAAMLVARAFAAAGRPQPAGAVDRFLAIYSSRLLRFTRPYAAMREVLEALSARAVLAVLTNKPLDPARRILTGLDLARYFAPGRLVGGDGPFPRKPDPAGLLHLVAEAGVAAGETLLVGDSEIDRRTARAAATRICLARYGFGFEGVPAGELSADDLLIDTPATLLALVS